MKHLALIFTSGFTSLGVLICEEGVMKMHPAELIGWLSGMVQHSVWEKKVAEPPSFTSGAEAAEPCREHPSRSLLTCWFIVPGSRLLPFAISLNEPAIIKEFICGGSSKLAGVRSSHSGPMPCPGTTGGTENSTF